MSPELPFFDASALHAPLLQELQEAAARVHGHGRYIGGPEVAELEARLGDEVGAHCVTCSSGTMALCMALMALGVGAGDEVIVPAYTFAAPVEAVLLLGAIPVLADIEADTCILSATAATAAITPRTRAIIAVSLYGQPADFDALQELAHRHGIALIEDAAQSYGASLHGVPSGRFGDVACTSFFPTKPLGGCGDGGAIFTRDATLAAVLREIRDHGQSVKYVHVRLGLNGRLDTLSCAALLVKHAYFQRDLARRRELAARYDLLLPSGLPRLRQRAGVLSAWALYAIRSPQRDRLRDALAAAGVQTAVHYPLPLHRQPAFATACRWLDLHESERAARELLCLPLHAGLADAEQDRVIDALAEAVGLLGADALANA
ncbi:DegT/DnrJ/EryC1/StrS family aminotransferase [Lysobacter tyrosinilyticus]